MTWLLTGSLVLTRGQIERDPLQGLFRGEEKAESGCTLMEPTEFASGLDLGGRRGSRGLLSLGLEQLGGWSW